MDDTYRYYVNLENTLRQCKGCLSRINLDVQELVYLNQAIESLCTLVHEQLVAYDRYQHR